MKHMCISRVANCRRDIRQSPCNVHTNKLDLNKGKLQALHLAAASIT